MGLGASIMALDDVAACLHAERLLGICAKPLLGDCAFLAGWHGPYAKSVEWHLASLPTMDWPLIKGGICVPIVCVQKCQPAISSGVSNTGQTSKVAFPCC